MISVLRFVGVLLAGLLVKSVNCLMAVSATGSRPLDKRLLPGEEGVAVTTCTQECLLAGSAPRPALGASQPPPRCCKRLTCWDLPHIKFH